MDSERVPLGTPDEPVLFHTHRLFYIVGLILTILKFNNDERVL
jgi:hypothetical protein